MLVFFCPTNFITSYILFPFWIYYALFLFFTFSMIVVGTKKSSLGMETVHNFPQKFS